LGGWVYWFTPVILALGRQKQEDHEFKTSPSSYQDPASKTKYKTEELGV
jgi:hypothetical protein